MAAEAYYVAWKIGVEAENPLEAARKALAVQRHDDLTATIFHVRRLERPWRLEKVELGQENPFGRPSAVIEGDEVCCGHCGSGDTRCLEDVGRYTRMWIDDGRARTWCGDQTISDEGRNPRVWCVDCEKESQLPVPFEW